MGLGTEVASLSLHLEVMSLLWYRERGMLRCCPSGESAPRTGPIQMTKAGAGREHPLPTYPVVSLKAMVG